MITIDGKQYRNLQEQVLQNQQDIQYLLHEGGVLNEFGIKVVGQVDTVDELPDAATYQGEYGDAYAVGTDTPYTFYIWTRQISGQTGSFWFNVGLFPGPSTVPGPTGPTGATGAAGQRGSLWSSQSGIPSAGANDGDQALDTNTGDVYQFVASSNTWQRTGNISGPIGPQGPIGPTGATGQTGPAGPMGPTGPQGKFIEIIGELSNTNQLPMIDDVPRYAAYLIPSQSGAQHVWLIIGEGTTDNPFVWHDGGVVGGVVGGTEGRGIYICTQTTPLPVEPYVGLSRSFSAGSITPDGYNVGDSVIWIVKYGTAQYITLWVIDTPTIMKCVALTADVNGSSVPQTLYRHDVRIKMPDTTGTSNDLYVYWTTYNYSSNPISSVAGIISLLSLQRQYVVTGNSSLQDTMPLSMGAANSTRIGINALTYNTATKKTIYMYTNNTDITVSDTVTSL